MGQMFINVGQNFHLFKEFFLISMNEIVKKMSHIARNIKQELSFPGKQK